jgi:hypothetical protein
MTMHVVLGDGEMTRKELTETLQDIWNADEKDGQTFWFLLHGKPEPTDTDKALVNWLEKNEIYYEVITDDADSVHPLYSQPQETHVAKQMSRKIVSLLKSKPEEGEPAELLALFYSDDSEAEEDRWLNEVCQDVFDSDYKIRALNDGLLEVDLAAAPDEPPAPVTPIGKKSVAKKGGAARRADTAVSGEDATGASSAYTREQLEEMELPQIKEIAAGLGLEFPPRTRMATYIDAILGEGAGPTVEVQVQEAAEAVLRGNGDVALVDVESLADAIAEALLRKLAEVLQ